jgi:hypothetical protein
VINGRECSHVHARTRTRHALPRAAAASTANDEAQGVTDNVMNVGAAVQL